MRRFLKETKHARKSLISWLLVLTLLVQTVVIAVTVLPMFAQAGSANAEVKSTTVDSGIAYITSKNLSYYGDRTYKLSLTATTSLRESHETGIRTSSEDGYFTASENGTGYYLLEIYGGDGGEGGSAARGGDGVGGKGGYAYGYIKLDEGDTLVYTVGTIGDSTIYAGEEGSGENNEDGNHGDDGAYAVGGGGGYSAIYLIPADEDGKPTYVKPESGPIISEEQRLHNYIMIAGGGGGGGAGNGALYPNTGKANGGAGGTVSYGSGIPLTAEENSANGGVAGTYFSGYNGETSGAKIGGLIPDVKYDYVGKGGTNVPGKEPDTWTSWKEAGPAKAWADGGSGGNGNYRGGGGGAGFAGGSGGIMAGALIPANIGGGGGGSSFIANSVNTFPIDVDEDDPLNDLASLLQGPEGNDNVSGSGGKVVITFIGADPNTKAFTEHLEEVTIKGEISQYFDIISVSADNGTAAQPEVNWVDNKITVTGANITPDDLGYEDADNFCRVDIIFRAKEEFFGGNAVPVLANDVNFTLTTAEKDYKTPEGIDDKHFAPMTFYFAGAMDSNGEEYDNSADYCNVSLLMTAIGNSYSFSLNNIPDPFKSASDLYVDEYTAYRDNMQQLPSAYLESIGEYVVTDQSTGAPVNGVLQTPTAAGTWNYTVGFWVKPLKEPAVVGPDIDMNGEFISDTAVILVLAPGSVPISGGDGMLLFDKLLSYENGQYHFQMSVRNKESEDSFNIPYKEYHRDTTGNGAQDDVDDAKDFDQDTNMFKVEYTGWYAIGARGGKGGRGGDAAGSNRRNEGGAGATGSALTGYVYLEKGDTLAWYIGGNGADGIENGGPGSGAATKNGTGGQGGQCTWIALRKADGSKFEPLVIAAGGAGGSGGVRNTALSYGNDGPDGESAATNDTSKITNNIGTGVLSFNGDKGGEETNANRTAPQTKAKNSFRSDKVKTNVVVKDTTWENSLPGFDEATAASVFVSLIYYTNEDIYIGTNAENSRDDMGRIQYNGQPVSAANGFYENLEFDVEFDRYFDLNSFSYNTSAAVELTADEVANGKSGVFTGVSSNYTVSASGNGVNVHLDPNDYDGKTYAFLTGNETEGYALSLKPSTFKLTYDFYLTPKEGFVGGNDVPLLKFSSATDDQGVEYAGIGVKIPHDDTTRYVEEQDESDYTNVAISYAFNTEDFVTKQGITIDCGDELDGINDLLEQNEDGTYKDVIPHAEQGTDDYWKWEFVNVLNAREVYARAVAADPSAKIGGTLFETTPYTLTQCIEPKYPNDTDHTALKAVVVGSVSPLECDNHVTITVVRPVQEMLTNATIEYDTSAEGVEPDESGNTVKVSTEADLTGVIVAEKGYDLPADITVYVCGTEMTSGYTYDQITGAFTIPAEEVRKLVADDGLHKSLDDALENAHQHVIVIVAEATEQTLELSFVWWELDESGSGAYTEYTEFGEEFLAYVQKSAEELTLPSTNKKSFVTGADLTNDSWFKQFLALDHIDLPNHKEFKWVWGTNDESPLTEMPGANQKIPGYVTDKTYYVTVHYVSAEDYQLELATSTQVFGAFEHEEVVVSPEIRGWAAKKASTVVKIVEDAEGKVITDVYIEYTPAPGKLNVYFVYADTNAQIGDTKVIELTEEGTQTVEVPSIDHYTARYEDEDVKGGSVDIQITADDAIDGKSVYIYYHPDQYTLTFDAGSADVSFRAGGKTDRTVEYNNSFGYDADEEKFIQFPQPERKGYEFVGWYTQPDDGEKITESTQINDYVEGLAAGGEITLYAHWQAIDYKVTVNYTFIDKEGSAITTTSPYWPAGAEESHEHFFNYESPYSVELPEYPGFELTEVSRADSIEVVDNKIEGIMPAVDLVYNVTYTQLTYTLTVEFAWAEEVEQSADLPKLPEKKTFTLVYGENYSYSRDDLENGLTTEEKEALADYSTIPASVSGTMGAADATITVYYTDAVSHVLEWEDFVFLLSGVEYDVNTHDYIGYTITPENPDSNYVKVTNNGSKDLPVEFKYTPAADKYSVLEGSFTIDNGGLSNNKANVPSKGSSKATLNLSLSNGAGVTVTDELINGGLVDGARVKNQFISGVVTVVIGEQTANGSEGDEVQP